MIPITQIAILKGGLDKSKETPPPTVPSQSKITGKKNSRL